MEHKVALIDDHHIVRSGLVAVINSLKDFSVSIEAGNGKEFIAALSGQEDPAIAVVDLNMPVMDGYETIAWLAERHPGIRTLALTLDNTDDAMTKAIRSGARGFIRKNARPAELRIALESIMLTGYFHSEAMHRGMMSNPELKTRKEKKRDDVLARITPREMEFLAHVCSTEEPTYEQIADLMSISRRTVDHFRQELFEKFHIKSKAGLVLFAVQWKLVGF